MDNFLEKMFGKSRSTDRQQRSRQLRLESLEDRQMLDATGLVAPALDLDYAAVEVAEADADVPAIELGTIVVTSNDDGPVNHADDFKADGTPGNITLREAFDYLGRFTIPALKETDSTYYATFFDNYTQTQDEVVAAARAQGITRDYDLGVHLTNTYTYINKIEFTGSWQTQNATVEELKNRRLPSGRIRLESTIEYDYPDQVSWYFDHSVTVDGSFVNVKGEESRICIDPHINGTGRALSVETSGYRSNLDKPFLSNIEFINHTVSSVAEGEQKDLGALYFHDGYQVGIDNCLFFGFYGDNGAAISTSGVELTLNDCSFVYNASAHDGGAIYVEDCYSTYLNNCYFEGNVACGSGGAVYTDSDSIFLNTAGCVYEKNTASAGGAVYVTKVLRMDGDQYIENGGFFTDRNRDRTLSNIYSEYGGAIYSAEDELSLDNALFLHNGAVVADGVYLTRGGAIYNADSYIFSTGTTLQENYGYYGGAIYNKGFIDEVDDTAFIGNEAYLGGGLYNTGWGRVNINYRDANNRFIGNVARFSDDSTQAHGSGGAIYQGVSNYEKTTYSFECGNMRLVEVEFIDNVAYKYGGAIANYGTHEGALSSYQPQWAYTVYVENCDFSGNTASVGGAICNAGEMFVLNGEFSNNSAICGGDPKSLDGHDWFYARGGNGGAIYNANNATNGKESDLVLRGDFVFEGNSASRAGGALDLVGGNFEFDYYNAGSVWNSATKRYETVPLGGSFVFKNNFSLCGMGGAIVVACDFDDLIFNSYGAPSDAFTFEGNDAWYAQTIGVHAKYGEELRALVEEFGYDYSALTLDQVATFTRYATDLVDEKITYEYLTDYSANLYSDVMTVRYAGAGSTGWTELRAGEFATLAQLGVPQDHNVTKAGSYKLEFFYGSAEEAEAAAAAEGLMFELVFGVTKESRATVMTRRIEMLGTDEQGDRAVMSGFSFITYEHPIQSVVIDWGDGSDVWTTNVESFYATVYHMFPEEKEWDPTTGASDPNVYTIKCKLNMLGLNKDKHSIETTFQYQVHGGDQPNHLTPGSIAEKALLEDAFADEDLFDLL